ncbi:Fucose 4-O-acetylase [Prevotella sp. khp1]|uniref:acyltransferase family protein n=1 Tax=Prevotellaceae TaxID=171552 RepID=UPI0008875BDC|nr:MULTISPECIES: acyltransferase [Prevotellaceae]QVJ80693.1 acyltransferase [Xylanibacter ruminicola]SDQ15881.1 Fucose 4-O-acetylase [Prevotella sp. khp1]
MNRINWIDWAKAFCMTVVVFCHLPQQEDTFHLQFLASVILSTFFFVSGYLKKKNLSVKESAKKYGYALLIPYIIYNVIYYPYWLAKFYIEHGGITCGDAVKPIVGTMLGQLNSSFSCELNGVTWFLIALFLMHILTDVLNKNKHGKTIMLILSVITMILYGANKHYHYAPYITYHGLIRCLCFFFLGNLYRQWGKLKHQQLRKDLLIGTTALLASLILFYWHINESNFILHIILYYVVNFVSVYAFIYLSKSLNHIKSRTITLISIGTMLIFGLHRIMIGVIDFGIEKFLHHPNIQYDWIECLIIALMIEMVLLPITIYRRKYSILFGKDSHIQTKKVSED